MKYFKKIIIVLICVLCPILFFGITAKCETLNNLADSPNYKGMSIIPKGTKCNDLLYVATINCSDNSNPSVAFSLTLTENTTCEIGFISPTNRKKNGITIFSSYYTFNYLLNNNRYVYNDIDKQSIDIPYFTYNASKNSVKFSNICETDFFMSLSSTFLYKDTSLDTSLHNSQYVFCLVIRISNINSDTYFDIYNDGTHNWDEVSLSINFIYNFNYIYSYYAVNSMVFPYDFYKQGYLNCNLQSVAVMQSSTSFYDLTPSMPYLRTSTTQFYGAFMGNIIYDYYLAESYTDKGFSSVSNGYIDLYMYGVNGQYNLDNYTNGIYFVPDNSLFVSGDYFNINFKYFAYQVSYNLPNVYSFNIDTKGDYKRYLNNECYYNNNTGYYYNDVGSTDNTDLINDLGIHYINCDWWNLKGQLNNLFYYLITGLPFLNNVYSLCLNAFGIVKTGFNFFTWSVPLTCFLGFIISIKILFNKMLE